MRRLAAFTLIELLVVIGIIAILAGLLFPAIRGANRLARVSRAQTELSQVQACIDAYKTKLGFYPPDNRSPADGHLFAGLNQLYYELRGTSCTDGQTFAEKDNSGPALTTNMLYTFFGPGVTGLLNADRGSSDEGRPAVRFLKFFKPNQVTLVTLSNDATKMTVSAKILVCTVPGTDPNSPPLMDGTLNPWRYNSSSPTNNPGTYDLWADIVTYGKAVRVCNWSSKPIPLP